MTDRQPLDRGQSRGSRTAGSGTYTDAGRPSRRSSPHGILTKITAADRGLVEVPVLAPHLESRRTDKDAEDIIYGAGRRSLARPRPIAGDPADSHRYDPRTAGTLTNSISGRTMNRFEFRKRFKTVGPAVLAVVHARDHAQVVRNAQIAAREGAHGVVLINHDFGFERLLPLVRAVRDRFPSLWLGVNFLAVTGERAFPVLGELQRSGCTVDAYWADDACIDERSHDQPEAEAIAQARSTSGWRGLYLGGTAFKKQRPVRPEHFETAARIAARFMDAITTSGVATGRAADVSKIERFRAGCGDQALAIASGVTADNAAAYAALVDAILVATGINRAGDFHEIEPMRLRRLLAVCREVGAGAPEPSAAAGWYLPPHGPERQG